MHYSNSLFPAVPPRTRLSSFVPIALLCLSVLVPVLSPFAGAGTIRSCKYEPGSQGFGYAAADRFNRNVTMTLEAWVYREDNGSNQAIIEHDQIHSYWFGFDPDLTFYRSGGGRAVADIQVRRRQWTHVAVNYNGSHARFYIDGVQAGTKVLTNTGAGHSDNVVIGKRFVGSLDEVRLWSIFRTREEIRANMEVEVRSGAGLEAVWADGGPEETLQNLGGAPLAGGGLANVSGILPRALTVPRTEATINLDGTVGSVEYAGAEQLVLRYRDGNNVVQDATAYLVRTAFNLYVGIRGARHPGDELWQSRFEVYLDPLNNGADRVYPQHLSCGIKLADGGSEFRRGHEPFNPFTGTGGFGWNPAPASGSFAAAMSSNAPPNEFTMADMEFRIGISELGSWSDLDRLAIGHRHPGSVDFGHRYAPDLATDLAPGSWTEMRYGGSVEGPPSLSFHAQVIATSGAPVANVPIHLSNSEGPIQTRTTSSFGDAHFSNLQFDPDRTLFVSLDSPADSLNLPTIMFGEGIAPTLVSATQIEFPACGEPQNGQTCLFQSAQFRLALPPPPVELGTFSPLETWPTTQVRQGSDPRWIAPGLVEIQGQNLHNQLRFYLVDQGCPTDPVSAPQCIEGQHYHEITDVQLNGSDLACLTIPDLNEFEQGSYRIAAHDLWDRPGNVPTSPNSWKYAVSSVTVGPPPYPMVHGFHFHNRSGGGSFEEMTDVYGFNMFADPLISCAPWPHYLLWFPIYRELANNDGSCLGISATSRLLEMGHHDLQAWDPDALFANGHFTNGPFQVVPDSGDPFYITHPPSPDLWTFDFPCRFAATNLWGEICRHHGAQFSSEMISSILPQLFGSGSGADRVWSEDGEPISVFNRVANDPSNYVVCMSPVAGSGHCVTPYKVSYGERLVRDENGLASTWETEAHPDYNLIHVYDNNAPDRVSFIEIDTVRDQFLFPNLINRGDPMDPGDDYQHYAGRAITASPISIWQAQHVSMPGLDLAEYLHLLIFGSGATGTHRDSKGQEWGWNSAGERVESIPDVKAVPAFSGPEGDARHVQVFVPSDADLVSSDLGVREAGAGYGFYAAHLGTQLRFRVPLATPNQTDQVKLIRSSIGGGGSLDGIEIAPGQPRKNADLALGVIANKDSSVTFTLDGLDLAANSDYRAEVLRAGPGNPFVGLRLHNGGTTSLTPDLTVDFADRGAKAYGRSSFPSIQIPAGATASLALAHWPAFDTVRLQLDINSDGTIDHTSTLNHGIPDLEVAREGGNVTVRYPVEFSGWTLEESQTLDGGWIPIIAKDLVHDEHFVTARFSPNGTRFFRLRRP